MTTPRRSLRAAQAVAAVVVASVLLHGLLGVAGATEDKECRAEKELKLTLEEEQDEVQFKCADDNMELVPGDLDRVFSSNKGPDAQPVLLESLLHKAVLTSDNSTPATYTPAAAPTTVLLTSDNKTPATYTLALAPTTVVQDRPQVLYYYCRGPAKENHCTVEITVNPRAVKSAGTCESNSAPLTITMDKDDTIIKFACDPEYKTLLPDGSNAYVTPGNRDIPLEKFYIGAQLTRGKDNNEHTLTVAKRRSSKILYFRCQNDSSNTCDVQITVEKNTTEEDPGAVPEEATCHADGQVEVTLFKQHPGVAFACGLDVPLLDPTEPTHIYEGHAGESPVELAKLFTKASLHTDSSVAAYAYFLYIPYRDEPSTLHYNCVNKTTRKTCKVLITVEANKDVVPVCDSAETGAYLSYEDFSDNVKFQCGADYTSIDPRDLASVYEQDPTGPSAQPVKLTSLYSGAKLVSDGDRRSPTFTLTIPPHLPRKAKNIYYHCKKGDNDYCTVHIRVAAKQPQVITCDKGSEKAVTITDPAEIVRFKCGDSMTLHPGSDQQVHDNKDGSCSLVADLATLVPGAKLGADEEGKDTAIEAKNTAVGDKNETVGDGDEAVEENDKADEDNGEADQGNDEAAKGEIVKRMTFSKLPSTDQALCYSCRAEGAAAEPSVFLRASGIAEQCKVLINVKSAAMGLRGSTLAGHALILLSIAGVLFSAA